jgi:hypothetical protein
MYENGVYPTWPLNEHTLVFDPATNRQVTSFEGRLVLPIGATIELYDADKSAHGTATVIGVRVLNGTPATPNQICLDVEVEDRWWDAHPYEG